MERVTAAFAGRLRGLRKLRGLTQEELGCRAGLSQSAISQLESGDRTPSLATLRRLWGALDVTVGELLPWDRSTEE